MPQTAILLFQSDDGIAPLADWINHLETHEPKAHTKCLERVLRLSSLGYELRRPLADSLRDGIHELRAKVGRVNYRILYFFHGQNCAVLSHGFTKEGDVPDIEINLAVRRKKLVESDPKKYTTTEW